MQIRKIIAPGQNHLVIDILKTNYQNRFVKFEKFDYLANTKTKFVLWICHPLIFTKPSADEIGCINIKSFNDLV